MAQLLSPAIAAGVGLKALVVYGRPAPRRELLGQIADLGILVVENLSDEACASVASSAAVDVALVFAAETGDAAVVQQLIAAQVEPVLVSVPDGVDAEPFLRAGAFRCVSDSEFVASATGLIAAAATAARARRDAGPHSPAPIPGQLLFDARVPSVALGSRTRTLSRSESAVLQRLREAAGYPVDAAELERTATPDGQHMRPGFLKATVLRLRRKLIDLGMPAETIRTVRGYGYALCVETDGE